MEYKLRGLVSHTDKFDHAYIVFMSDYHYGSKSKFIRDLSDKNNIAGTKEPMKVDHTKNILQLYEKKFQSSDILQDKTLQIEENTDKINITKFSIKSPIKGKNYMVCIKNTKYYNLDGDLVGINELKTREVIITATIQNYSFYKNKKREKIVGWRIVCKTFKII